MIHPPPFSLRNETKITQKGLSSSSGFLNSLQSPRQWAGVGWNEGYLIESGISDGKWNVRWNLGYPMECGILDGIWDIHGIWNVPCPSFASQTPPHLECSISLFSIPVPTSARMEPERNLHGSASLGREASRKTLGISPASLGEEYSWISPLKFASLPVNPHWKFWEVFPNGMSPHKLWTLWFPTFPCMESMERIPPCTEVLPTVRVKYSRISPLKLALLPIYPHWKFREVFSNGMSPHRSHFQALSPGNSQELLLLINRPQMQQVLIIFSRGHCGVCAQESDHEIPGSGAFPALQHPEQLSHAGGRR